MKIDLALMEQFAALGIGSTPVAGDQMSGEFAALLSQLTAAGSVLNSESASLPDGENAENLADMLLAELGGELPVNDQLEAGEDKNAASPIIQALNGQLVLVADVTPKAGSAGVHLPPEASDVAAAKIKAFTFIDYEKAAGQNADAGKAADPGSGADAEKAANKPEGKGLFEQAAHTVRSELSAEGKALPAEAKALPAEGKDLPAEAKALPAEIKALKEEPVRDTVKTGSSNKGDDKVPGNLKAAPDAVSAVLDKAKAAPVDPKAVSDAAKAINEQKPANFRSFVDNSARQGELPVNETASSKPEQPVTGSADSTQKPVDNLFRSENGSTKAQASATASEQPFLGQQPSIQGDHSVRAEAVLQSQQNPNLRESVLQQLEGRMIYLRETGNNPAEMRMTLHPPELGEVTIRVFSKQGVLSASIIAETTLVKEILESSISELRQRLNFVEIQFEQLDLSTPGRQSGESDRPARNFNPDELAQLGLDRPDHLNDEGVNDPLRASPGGETMGVDYFA